MTDLSHELREHAARLDELHGEVELSYEPMVAVMRRAADEIERLRSLAGAVSPAQTVTQIKEMLRKHGYNSLWGMKEIAVIRTGIPAEPCDVSHSKEKAGG